MLEDLLPDPGRASLRVLRSSNRTPSRFSNSATRRLIRDFGTFNAREAAENQQLRTTARKKLKIVEITHHI
jgi:hypothetical protein